MGNKCSACCRCGCCANCNKTQGHISSAGSIYNKRLDVRYLLSFCLAHILKLSLLLFRGFKKKCYLVVIACLPDTTLLFRVLSYTLFCYQLLGIHNQQRSNRILGGWLQDPRLLTYHCMNFRMLKCVQLQLLIKWRIFFHRVHLSHSSFRLTRLRRSRKTTISKHQVFLKMFALYQKNNIGSMKSCEWLAFTETL